MLLIRFLFAPFAVILFTGWDDGTIRMFDGRRNGGEALNEFKDAHRGAVMCVALSPNEVCATRL